MRPPESTRGLFLPWTLKVLISLAQIAHVTAAAFVPHPLPVLLPLPAGAGQALVIAGAVVALVHFAVLRAVAGPLGADRGLVTNGALYRWIRHPMYLGDLAVMVGFTLIRTDAATLTLLAAWIATVYALMGAEEARLDSSFGASYRRWRARTGRLFPGFSPATAAASPIPSSGRSGARRASDAFVPSP